jgi:hypothetical protein
LKSAVCELRTLKELVSGAYADLPVGPAAVATRCSPIWRQALAAGLLLSLGLGGGWFAHGRAGVGTAPEVAGLPAGYMPIALAARVDPNKIVLHLDSSDPDRFASVLNLADRILKQRGAQAQVEVLVNSYGLNLLRTDTTPYQAEIERLSRNHVNLSFTACAQTVARLKREGVNVQLVPEAGMATSAINEIVGRMQQGWVYVKV